MDTTLYQSPQDRNMDFNFNMINFELTKDGQKEMIEISPEELSQFDPTMQYDVQNTNNSYQNYYDYQEMSPTSENSYFSGTPSPFSPAQSEFSGKAVNPRKKGGRKKNLRPPSPAILKQRREAANARERKRMNGLNDAFERLRDVVPNMTTEQKMSKIETLRMAQAYIKTLANLVENEENGSPQPSASTNTVEVDMFELI
ncbi:pancreas transcription factor 1 subunit alpha [Eurytemora carolleeae]|uniref:pancreas transcription factor 1 subunit alpha n=1 Tax=Eurytemora carolleeae TaxID=1294199 RepID=UPI000C77FD09|nr:pancreas transcription factor 1 subunit alpha [Eurytemora carolleeae]|eukprot:XP_023329245.1 pancreas transcription factor 1 subunit alpha-like [Eurytemora affinis]